MAFNGNADHMIVIEGLRMDVEKAEMEIKNMIHRMPNIFTKVFFVPVWACGRVIGREGSSIKKICFDSNCVIKLDHTIYPAAFYLSNVTDLIGYLNGEEKQIISIKGSFEHISKAQVIKIILKII